MSIWDMKIPPRIKVFLSRLYRNVIPTRMGPKDKWVKCPAICPVCEAGRENACHLFLCCWKSQDWWKKTVMWDCISAAVMPSSLQSTADIVFHILDRFSAEQRAIFRNENVGRKEQCGCSSNLYGKSTSAWMKSSTLKGRQHNSEE